MTIMPPMVQTEETPEDIIGPANYQTFCKHYQICQSSTNQGEFPDKRLDKEVGSSIRPRIAETLSKLREHGFYPDGFKGNGDILWRRSVKSACQIEFERGLGQYIGKSISELSAVVKAMKHSATVETVKHIKKFIESRRKA